MIEVAGSDEKIYRTTYSTFNYLYKKATAFSLRRNIIRITVFKEPKTITT